MTELEWLKQQSGYTDEDLKSFESVMGSAKFVTMLQKIHQSSEQALKDKQDAEQARLDFENRYNNEFIPEMRKVTGDALQAQGEAARLKAQLDKAREYGIVPEPEKSAADPNPAPVRAPGSPDPNSVTRDDFGRLAMAQGRSIVELQDINADHFRLFGSPLGNTQEILDEMQRQHTLGNRNYSLRQAWESKYDVAKKRDELKLSDQKKHDDEVRAAAVKEERERRGANPNVHSGVPSRFSTYKPSDSNAEPWKAPRSKNQANKGWRDNALAKVREAVAA